MALHETTDATFDDDVINSMVPVVVDFWADWCGPCKMIAPALEAAAAELGDRVSIVKLNIDDNQATAIRYGVRSIPTLLLFKDGEAESAKVGALPQSKIIEWIEEHLPDTADEPSDDDES